MYSPNKDNLVDNQPYKIYEIKKDNHESIPGYLVVSTAKLNVETEEENSSKNLTEVTHQEFFNTNRGKAEFSTEKMIEKIAKNLESSSEPEIIINIHGYSSTPSDTEIGCKKIYDYINNNIQQPNKYVFIGYRWPSENPVQKDESGSFVQKVINSFSSLPILLAISLGLGLTISILSIINLLFFNFFKNFNVLVFTISLIISSIIFTLIILRLSTYFRDIYRASNYGVIDLVELLRQLDYSVNLPHNKRIKVSFIGHSMGCFVVTNVIRILSDIFDVKSINKKPDSNIGNVFRLGRLVLVAADIPVESILPGRANFLRSSLRRCEEAYVFCNEGDLALRFTSTAANYFSFPARTRISGYRLGNITVKHFKNKNDLVGHTPRYGIINLFKQDSEQTYRFDNPYKYLEIRSSSSKHRSLEEMAQISEQEIPPADLFTYFDCTDYKEQRSKQVGIVSCAIKKPAINFGDYFFLTWAFVRKSINNRDSQGVDTHTGYFEGDFSQKAIYELAFLGFNGFLTSFSTAEEELKKIDAFADKCQEKQIQVILSPQLYQQKTQE